LIENPLKTKYQSVFFLSAFTLFQFSFTLKREKSDKNLEEEKRRILGGGFETAMVGNWGKA
jgi:hypothetical protein